jgi:hypothetical protein
VLLFILECAENHISKIIALKAKSENLPLELFENFKKRYVE